MRWHQRAKRIAPNAAELEPPVISLTDGFFSFFCKRKDLTNEVWWSLFPATRLAARVRTRQTSWSNDDSSVIMTVNVSCIVFWFGILDIYLAWVQSSATQVSHFRLWVLPIVTFHGPLRFGILIIERIKAGLYLFCKRLWYPICLPGSLHTIQIGFQYSISKFQCASSHWCRSTTVKIP